MNELKTFNEVYDAVYNWHIKNMKDEFIENGKTAYKKALSELGFRFDGYDEYGSNTYSNGHIRVALYYDRGDCCWYIEEGMGSQIQQIISIIQPMMCLMAVLMLNLAKNKIE